MRAATRVNIEQASKQSNDLSTTTADFPCCTLFMSRACCHHYPGGIAGCVSRSLAQRVAAAKTACLTTVRHGELSHGRRNSILADSAGRGRDRGRSCWRARRVSSGVQPSAGRCRARARCRACVRCLTVSRISSAAAEMVIGAVSQRRAIHLGALDPLPDLVETRRGCKATAAASSKCVRSSGSGWRLTV